MVVEAREPTMSEADESLSFMAARFRDRAEEARTMADGFHDLEARRMMFEIAERYEKLARRIEIEGS
jgi:hypothetical protein